MFNFLMLISSIVLLSLDYVYLNFMKNYFLKQVKSIQNTQPKINFLGVALCYVFLIAGINYFIIKSHKSATDAFLLGCVIYGVYETTNYALFSNWSLMTVIIDTLWGGILFATTTYVVNLLR